MRWASVLALAVVAIGAADPDPPPSGAFIMKGPGWTYKATLTKNGRFEASRLAKDGRVFRITGRWRMKDGLLLIEQRFGRDSHTYRFAPVRGGRWEDRNEESTITLEKD